MPCWNKKFEPSATFQPARGNEDGLSAVCACLLAGAARIALMIAGYEGHRGWINYLAVSVQHQGVGNGKRMMAAAESPLRAQGCPKINLQVRSSNAAVIAFYRSIGYRTEEVVSLGKHLEPDE